MVAAIASYELGRDCVCIEIDETYFLAGMDRVKRALSQVRIDKKCNADQLTIDN